MDDLRKNRKSTDHIAYSELHNIPPSYTIELIKTGELHGVQEGDTWYVIEEEYRPTPKVQITDIKIPIGSIFKLSLKILIVWAVLGASTGFLYVMYAAVASDL